jgi:hypothetical protein
MTSGGSSSLADRRPAPIVILNEVKDLPPQRRAS